MRASPARILRAGALAQLLVAAASCTSLEVERRTPTSGTFRSTAWAFTILSFDFPTEALQIARGNASDAGLPNTVIRRERVFPHLGPFDILLDAVSIRHAKVKGTWGYPTDRAQEPATEPAAPDEPPPPAPEETPPPGSPPPEGEGDPEGAPDEPEGEPEGGAPFRSRPGPSL